MIAVSNSRSRSSRFVRTIRAFAVLGLALSAWLVGLSGSAAAGVVHEQEGTFPLPGLDWLSVDNSGGPSDGDLYVGQVDLAGFASRVYQADETGSATGVELNGSETPAGSFGFVDAATFRVAGGPAVDSSGGPNAGDIYVPDIVNGVVDLFDESGTYLCQVTGLASPSPSECAGISGSQTPRGGLEPLAVAVDPVNGDLIVGDASGVLYVFDSTGKFKSEIAGSQITEPGSLAVDSGGNIYVVNESPFFGPGEAVKFSPSGTFEYALASSQLSAGVDLSNDHVYLGRQEGSIEEYDSGGTLVSTFGTAAGLGGGARSIGVNATTGQVFLTLLFADQGQIWSGDLFVPSVTTGPATAVAETTVTLNGEVDPETSAGGGPIESCRFEYVADAAFKESAWAGASATQCSPETPYSAATAVSAAVSGLSPATTYHYRLVAENSDGHEGEGEEGAFTTFGPPSISGETSIARTDSATVKAQINPFGYATSCAVEYVDQGQFAISGYAGAARVPCAEALPAGFEPRAVSVQLTGLSIGTGYHFRFVAHSSAVASGGTTFGEDQVFSTFGIESFSIEALDREGHPYTQAGGHPYQLKVVIALSTTETVGTPPPERPGNLESVSANLRTVRLNLPPGLIGNPTATPKCEPFQIKPQKCAADTQVAYAVVQSARGTTSEGPVFNLVPPSGVAAQLGGRFNTIGTVRINAGVRTGSDYGVDADTLSITADEGIKRIEMSVWGVPADEGHLGERFCPEALLAECASGAPLRPFLTTPTSCGRPLAATLSVDSWQDPGNFVSAASPMATMGGCNRLDFTPTIRVQPETTVADSPTGLHVSVHVPQSENPLGLAESNLRDAVVVLPRGLAINPAAASGLEACSPAQVELHGPAPAECPAAAKIGSVEVRTPLLDHPLSGGVYLAQQGNAGPAHGGNPFGSLLAIYVAVADPESGVVVKLAGHVEADPETGQLTTTFSENPQLPFEDFSLDFFGGPRAPLGTPPTCRVYDSTTRLTPWSTPEGADASPADSFEVRGAPGGGACAGSDAQMPNSPGFEAGTLSPRAGAFSPFVLRFSRDDGSQRLSRIDATLPQGLVGRLRGIPYCSEAAIKRAQGRSNPGDGSLEQTDPSCPAASQVGSVDVGAGVGSSPLSVSGKAYLAGPYRGAPLSLVIDTPAVAGPFNLGNVLVRTALYVDPTTLQITAKSDPLPTMLEGIPLDLRSVTVRIDRPNFILNPTSCDPMAVGGLATSTAGQGAQLSSRFQVGSCEGLPFKPRLALRLFGKTNRNGKPRFRAVLRMKPGEANIARARVNLPHSEFLEQAHIKTVCTRVQFAARNCPKGSIYGQARAFSPLLDKPLRGPVYLRSSSHKLPDLVAALNGQINVELAGRVDSGGNGGLRTSFEIVPDAPVSKFILEMKGGRKGLLVNSENLCSRRAKKRAIVRFGAHNGKVRNFKPLVKNDCRKKKQKRRGHG